MLEPSKKGAGDLCEGKSPLQNQTGLQQVEQLQALRRPHDETLTAKGRRRKHSSITSRVQWLETSSNQDKKQEIKSQGVGNERMEKVHGQPLVQNAANSAGCEVFQLAQRVHDKKAL